MPAPVPPVPTPLSLDVIVSEIRKINDDKYELFEGFPQDANETALRWSNAVHIYASPVLPTSLPVTSELGRMTFENIMKEVSPTPPGNGLILLPLAFTAYAIQLGLGMAPAFVAIPPPIPIIFLPIVPVGLAGASAELQANAMGSIIHLWFKTGTATPSAGGAPIIWS